MDFLKIINEPEFEFERIAIELFNNYAIQTHDALFRLVEIEFYWNSSKHIDTSTYERKHVDPKSGDWFFHYSGVDIALKSEQNDGHGGILIRSIYDTDTNIICKGPMVCSMKLFSGTNAFTQLIQTKIVPYSFSKSEIMKDKRVGLSPKENGSDKLNYRFLINPKE